MPSAAEILRPPQVVRHKIRQIRVQTGSQLQGSIHEQDSVIVPVKQPLERVAQAAESNERRKRSSIVARIK